ncbi:MAG TPA: cation diffusion facilitator family transporter [Treponemataceae bacterium]|jgi:cation diffusion facilitator family transporter|nr:cation diffusion facilitator family transporter [Treponemataceae bacterium]
MGTETAGRTNLVRLAALIALVGNAALAVSKLAVGAIGGSLAVLGDGIDSSTDVAIAAMTLAVAFVIDRPGDKGHPWGHHKAETVATIALAFVVMLAGFQLAASAVHRLLSPEGASLPGAEALVVTVASIAGKLLLALSQRVIGKRAGSAMILANAKNMTNDVVISASVLAGLAASIAFKLPFLDPAIALAVGAWVMKSAVGIFMDLNAELMDGNANDDLYKSLFDAVRSVPGAGNPHRARIRKMASVLDIDLDIEVDGKLSVREAHEIAGEVERAIRRSINDVYDIMVHVEPAGRGEHGEQYGLTARDVQ